MNKLPFVQLGVVRHSTYVRIRDELQEEQNEHGDTKKELENVTAQLREIRMANKHQLTAYELEKAAWQVSEAEMHKHIKNLDEVKKRLEKEVDTHQQTQDEVINLTTQLKEIEEKVDAQMKAHQHAKKRLEEEVDAHQQTKEEVFNLKTQLKEMEKKFGGETKAHQQVKKRLEEKVDAHGKTMDEVIDLQTQLKETEKKVDAEIKAHQRTKLKSNIRITHLIDSEGELKQERKNGLQAKEEVKKLSQKLDEVNTWIRDAKLHSQELHTEWRGLRADIESKLASKSQPHQRAARSESELNDNICSLIADVSNVTQRLERHSVHDECKLDDAFSTFE